MDFSDSTDELKLVRSPFTLAPLTKVAWDIKGPISPATLGGARYLLMGTCVVSSKRFVYLLKTKDETAEHILKAALEIQGLGGTLKIVKSDNGGEFVSDEFRKELLANRITYETTSPHSPHQNGIAERSNRSQCELAVACMLHAISDPNLWGWAIKSVAYITDRMPTRATDMMTSAHYMIHGVPADLSRLRTWGCDAFIHLPRNKQPSFGPRAVKGTFVGYDPHSLAYVVKVNKSFYRSGHVKFNEDLSSRQRPSAAQEQAYQQVFNDMDQDATLTQATQTCPTVVRDVPIEYDDGEDFPDDGLTEEIKADGDAIKPTSKVREAVSITASAPATAPVPVKPIASDPDPQLRRKSPRLHPTALAAYTPLYDSDDDEVPGLVDESDDDSDDDLPRQAKPSKRTQFKAKDDMPEFFDPAGEDSDDEEECGQRVKASASAALRSPTLHHLLRQSIAVGSSPSAVDPSCHTTYRDMSYRVSTADIVNMLRRTELDAAKVKEASSDDRKRVRGLVTTTSDKVATTIPTDKLNRTQRKRIAREAKLNASKAQAITSQATKVSSHSSSRNPPAPAGSTSGRAAHTVPAPTTATEGQKQAKQSREPEFWRSTNVKVREAEQAFVTGGYYDNAYESVVKDTLSAHDLQAQAEAIPDGGPDCHAPTDKQAMRGPDRESWTASKRLELQSLYRLGTFEVVDALPAGRRPLGFKWVHKVKTENGRPIKFKSRLTVMGCHQRAGIDFSETFSPVARLAALRLIIALGVTENFHYWQCDVGNAFPNADVDEEIYMKAPPEMNLPEGKFLRLKKALYGLKQASRQWHQLVRQFLMSLGFEQLRTDSCIFIKRDGDNVMIVVLYVDDMVIAATFQDEIKQFVKLLSDRFTITQRPLEHILGLRVSDTRDDNGRISLDLDAYTELMLTRHADCLSGRTSSTPLPHGTILSKTMCPTTEEERAEMRTIPYRPVIGEAMYLANALRLDIMFATNLCARYMSNPGRRHWDALQHLLRYLARVPRASIEYSPPAAHLRNKLIAYVDSDHATDPDDRKSTSGYVIFCNSGPIAWASSKQKSTSSSSAESEFKAMHKVSQEVMFLRQLIQELGYGDSLEPSDILEDNVACEQYVRNPVLHGRMKHIDIAYHVVKDWHADGQIRALRVPSASNLADGLTKIVTPALHRHFVQGTMVVRPSTANIPAEAEAADESDEDNLPGLAWDEDDDME